MEGFRLAYDIDPSHLRTLVAFADTGTLASAGKIVGRSPSAITAQMHKLQELVGHQLITRDGRRSTLTPRGEELVGHAREILSANELAWQAMQAAHGTITLSVGIFEDFVDGRFTEVVRSFGNSNRHVQIYLSSARSVRLNTAMDEGDHDIVITHRDRPTPDEYFSFSESLVWLAGRDAVFDPRSIPLAFMEAPCRFRETALRALETARRPYRLAASATSVSALLALVAAGLGITVRTKRAENPALRPAPDHLELPDLGKATFVVRVKPKSRPEVQDLADIIVAALQQRP
ncbi:LysR substrate-binding domain-containing protein [Erythrobacter aureus]|uniref:LysR family transcriptional regulator n=1 Tax=Erythrobacter aureus TaxID=2182384 RepID=A0A345YBK1_9SPHN|nr:LysR substrate-binding domain-containing protein [Erythrobacter aureus]AXK41303.1 LysR family transcriptional regulator [Erythrobacter aureus]